MPHHMQGAYDGFDTPVEAKKHYARCRTLKHFILRREYIARHDPRCSCGKRFSEHSRIANEHSPAIAFERSARDMQANRCIYNPRTKKIAIMTYPCSWDQIFGAIERLSRRM